MNVPISSSLPRLGGPLPRLAARVHADRLLPRLVLGSALFVATMFVGFLVLIAAIREERAAGSRAERAVLAISVANELERLLIDVQTGQRGFLITQQERFLEPSDSAIARLPKQGAALAALVSDPQQRLLVRTISAQIDSFVEDWSQPLVALARTDIEAARAITGRGEGKRRTDDLRRHFLQFRESEFDIARQRRAHADSAADRATLAVGATLAVSILLAGLLTLFLSRSVVRPVRRLSNAAGRLAEGDLEHRITPDGPAELRELSQSFNRMAGSLEVSHRGLHEQNAVLQDQATELARRETELEASRRFLETVLAQMAGGFVVVDADSERTMLANDQVEELMGVACPAGTPVEALFAHVVAVDGRPVDREHSPFAQAVREGRTTVAVALDVRHPDGTSSSLEMNVVPIRDEAGDVTAVAASFFDVTERKRDEHRIAALNTELGRQNARLAASSSELVRASTAKDRFLASMSHELRTPLNAIIGYSGAQLMGLVGELSAEQRRQLESIQSSGKHLLSLINDLLDVAKIGAGRFEIALGPVLAQDVVEAVVASLRPLADEKGLAIEVRLPAAPLVFESDSRAVHQILLNLGANAIKFTDRGTVTIEAGPRSGNGAIFAVSDTGRGIHESDRARIFEAFEQAEKDLGNHREGTGLGLHISRSLARLIGARLTVESTPGKGSTFGLDVGGT